MSGLVGTAMAGMVITMMAMAMNFMVIPIATFITTTDFPMDISMVTGMAIAIGDEATGQGNGA